MLVMGIESTCDETACSIVQNGKNILSNVISTQIDLHREYGGVVPELACRRHIDLMIPIIDKALEDAKCSLQDIDLFAVARGPGLIGPLLIGLTAAKTLAFATSKPLIGINHVEAHIYASMMDCGPIEFPALGVVISGGHTSLVLIHAIGSYEQISQTVDDAIGEAFDKVAKMLGLPYPGGPEIEKLAKDGNSKSFPFKPGHVKGKPNFFSFSGLKTAVMYTLKGQNAKDVIQEPLSHRIQCDIAASFQHTALMDVVEKTLAVANTYHCKHILFGGGVSNNQHLRELMKARGQGLSIHWPPQGLSLDNAAMIAGLGYHRFQQTLVSDPMNLEALTRIPF